MLTRDRIADELMDDDKLTATITMAEHTGMMRAQQAHLLGAVEIVRRQLIRHGIAISNLAERTFGQRWELSCLAQELAKTIELKDRWARDALRTDPGYLVAIRGSSTDDAMDVDASGPTTLPKKAPKKAEGNIQARGLPLSQTYPSLHGIRSFDGKHYRSTSVELWCRDLECIIFRARGYGWSRYLRAF